MSSTAVGFRAEPRPQLELLTVCTVVHTLDRGGRMGFPQGRSQSAQARRRLRGRGDRGLHLARRAPTAHLGEKGDATRATPVRGSEMKKQYDFRHGRRGAIVRAPSGKTRITIRIDDDILQWFREQVHKAGGGSYQTLINDALRSFAESVEHNLEDTLRRVLREERPRYKVQPKSR